MSDLSARQTSYFMEGNQENYPRAMQPGKFLLVYAMLHDLVSRHRLEKLDTRDGKKIAHPLSPQNSLI